MHSQLLLAVSQIHQQELREAAREARAVAQPRTRRFALPRHFRFTGRTHEAAPAVSAQLRTV